MFGNITALHLPRAGSAGSSLWGTDVRKVLDAPEATSDSATKTSHGTGGGSTTRNVDPYSTSTSVSGTKGLFGWAVDPTDMGSVTGALRFYPAGDHTSRLVLGHDGAVGGTATVYVYAYRVASAAAGRTRTLLGSTSASVSLPALSGEVVANIALTLPEIVFQPDETIQWMYEVAATGTVITGHVLTFYTGTRSGTEIRITTPELGVLANTAGTAAGTGAASGDAAIVLGTAGTAAGAGAATGEGASNAGTVGSAAGSVAVLASGSSVAGVVGTASGSSDATGSGSAVIGTVGTVEIGAGGSEAPTFHPLFIFDD